MRYRRGGDRAFETLSTSEALRHVLSKYRLLGVMHEQQILAAWREVVGERIASRSRAERITDRVLWIEVVSSAWLHELNLMRAQLTMRLVERFPPPRGFDEVRFRLAGRSRGERPAIPAARPPAPPPLPVGPPATGLHREEIISEAAAVEDPELRELIARVRITNDR